MVFALCQKLLESDVQLVGSVCSCRQSGMQFRLPGQAVFPDLTFMELRYWVGRWVRTAGLDSHKTPRKSTVT